MFVYDPQIVLLCVIILYAAGVSKSQAMTAQPTTTTAHSGLQVYDDPSGIVLKVDDSMPFIGESISFKCVIQPPEAEAEVPLQSVSWYKDGAPLRGWPNTTLTYTLTVTPVDSGIYRCRAQFGSFQFESAQVHVTVRSPHVLPFFIGGAVGGGAVICVIVAITCLCVRKRKKKARPTKGVPDLPELPTQSAIAATAKDVYEYPDVTNHVYEDILDRDASSEQRPQGIRPPFPVPRFAPAEVPQMTPNDNFYDEASTPDLTKPRPAAVSPAVTATIPEGSRETTPEVTDYVDMIGSDLTKPRPAAVSPAVIATIPEGSRETTPEDTDYVDVIGSGPDARAPAEYEQLDPEAMFNQWMVDNKINDETKEKLRQHGIHTIQDINNLSYPDMIEIGLNVGERNRIKKAKEAVS